MVNIILRVIICMNENRIINILNAGCNRTQRDRDGGGGNNKLSNQETTDQILAFKMTASRYWINEPDRNVFVLIACNGRMLRWPRNTSAVNPSKALTNAHYMYQSA